MTSVQAYPDPAANTIYNLLFADDLAPLLPALGDQAALFGEPPDVAGLERLAGDESAESRLRVLAFGRLREASAAPQALPMLGVVVEVGLEGGHDTLAAYADGRVRYLNHAGGVSVLETPVPAASEVAALLDAARVHAGRLAEAAGDRGAPPGPGRLRVTVLTGDRRRVADTDFASLDADPATAAIVTAALHLLGQLIALSAGDAITAP